MSAPPASNVGGHVAIVGIDPPQHEGQPDCLDQSALVQFGRDVARLAQGDLGMSFRAREPIASMIAARLPATLELLLGATLFAVFIGIPLGVTAARWSR